MSKPTYALPPDSDGERRVRTAPTSGPAGPKRNPLRSASMLGLQLEVDRCLEDDGIDDAVIRRIGPTLQRATKFFISRKVGSLRAVRPQDVEAFVHSRLDSGQRASVAAKHNRRSALRLLFRVARRLELLDGDPSLDVALPPKSSLESRPLDDDEIELCRDVAEWSSCRVAVAWALGEATARGAEIAALTLADVDLDAGTVWISGGPRTVARTGSLSEWGTAVLRRHAGRVGAGPLAYAGAGCGIAGQVSTCRAIGSVLLRAGLAGEPDIRPMSLAAWAGRRVLDETGSIEAAARVLGVRSLDRAARLIGHDWTR